MYKASPTQKHVNEAGGGEEGVQQGGRANESHAPTGKQLATLRLSLPHSPDVVGGRAGARGRRFCGWGDKEKAQSEE